MKNATACAKKLTSLLKKLPDVEPIQFADADSPIAVLVQSFLMAETTTEKAMTAYGRLRQQVVDHNDMRVTMPEEMVEYIGSRYPGAIDRCRRLRKTLRGIYLREHDVTLDGLKGFGKRDVKSYLESLEGMLPYVSARVMLMGYDVHAVPVDEQLRTALIAVGAADESANTAELSTWLARQIKAGDRLSAHLKLQVWAEGEAAKGKKRRVTAKTTAKTAKTASGSSTRGSTSRSKKAGGRGGPRGSSKTAV